MNKVPPQAPWVPLLLWPVSILSSGVCARPFYVWGVTPVKDMSIGGGWVEGSVLGKAFWRR